MKRSLIAVYEKADGRVWMGSMNARLLGRMFGGVTARVMGRTVAADQNTFLAAPGVSEAQAKNGETK